MNKTLKSEIKKFALATLGMALLGLSVNMISWKFHLISGGMPGYALNVNYATGLTVGRFLLIVNTIILLINFLIVGKTAGIKGIYGYIFLSFFIDWSRQFVGVQLTDVSFLNSSLLMTLGGIVGGLIITLVVSNGYSFGNYTSLVLIVQKFIKITTPMFFFLMDGILVVITVFAQGWDGAFFLLLNSIVFFYSFKFCLKVFEKSKS